MKTLRLMFSQSELEEFYQKLQLVVKNIPKP